MIILWHTVSLYCGILYVNNNSNVVLWYDYILRVYSGICEY